MIVAFVFFFVLYPAIWASLLLAEYTNFGWTRIVNRMAAEPADPDDDSADALAAHAAKLNQPTPAPAYEGNFAEWLKDHPYMWILPAIGGGLGLFGNLVPMGTNLILAPLLQILDITKTSDSTLALCFLSECINQGLFGLTAWSTRDARFFIGRALFLLPPCAWTGYMIGITNHLSVKDVFLRIAEESDDENMKEYYATKADINLLHTYLRIFWGCVMVFMSLVVAIGLCIGGINRFCCPSYSGGTTPGCKSFCQWIIVMACAFSTGYFFVANIGAGMGMTAFFTLSMFLGVETKRAMPTSIVIGGWTAIVPCIMCGINYKTIPYIRLFMMIPGMWFGAILAPWFSKAGGPKGDLIFYFFILLGAGTLIILYAGYNLNDMDEDVDINVHPMIQLEPINEIFGRGFAPTPSPGSPDSLPFGGRGKTA